MAETSSPPPPRRPAAPAAVLGLAVVAALIAWLVFRRGDEGTAENRAAGKEPTVGFVERAKEAGISFRMTFLEGEQGEKFRINVYDHGAGVSVGDVDGDGKPDVYFCNQLGSNALYRNLGGGKFEDVTSKAGVGVADRISVCAAFADYDNDGRQDLFVVTTRGGNVLFKNRGDGTFEDVTEKAGVALVAHSQGVTFFDADADGFLDLLVVNTAKWTTDEFDEATKHYVGRENVLKMGDLTDKTRELNRFYRNRGDGTFEDRSHASGLEGVGWGDDPAVFDFDEDGDLDVFIGNMFGASLLFRNDGKGVFSEVTREVLEKSSYGAIGSKAFDYDGDGRLDLFVVDMHSDMWTWPSLAPTSRPEKSRFKGPYGPRFYGTPQEEERWSATLARGVGRSMTFVFGNTLYRNLGGGKFEETSEKAGVETWWPWGIAQGDFDGDGFEDAFLPSGMGHPFEYWRSPLLMNRGDGTFVDRSKEAGLDPMPGGNHGKTKVAGRSPARSARSAATADFDGDGRLDLVVENFNDVPLLLMNRWPMRSWAEFRLIGTKSNRDAIGALVTVKVGPKTLVRQVQSAGGYLAQSSSRLHFGLGDAKKIDRLEVRWPSGAVEVLENLDVNRLREIREGGR